MSSTATSPSPSPSPSTSTSTSTSTIFVYFQTLKRRWRDLLKSRESFLTRGSSTTANAPSSGSQRQGLPRRCRAGRVRQKRTARRAGRGHHLGLWSLERRVLPALREQTSAVRRTGREVLR